MTLLNDATESPKEAKKPPVFSGERGAKHPKKEKPRILNLFIALLTAIPATVSMSIIFYLRQPQWILSLYYEDPSKDFLKDVFTTYVPLPVVVLIFLGLLLAFLYLGNLTGRRSVEGLLVGCLISLNINISLSMEYGGLKEIFLPIGAAGNALFMIGSIALVSRTVDLLYWLIDHAPDAGRMESSDAENRYMTLLISFFCLLAGWLPCMILCYPGAVPSDTVTQILSFRGHYNIDASHPVLATVFYGTVYSLGKMIGGDLRGMFFTLLMQALICSAAITYYAAYIGRITGSKRWQAAIVAYFALSPTWQSAMVSVLKDVLHTGIFLLFYVWYLKALSDDGSGERTFVNLFWGSFLISFTRKAAFYIALLAIIAVAIVQRKRYFKQALACLLATVVVFYAPTILIYPFLNVNPERKGENYSMQFQQVAYYCRTHQAELTPEEIAIVNTTLDYEAIVRDFTPKLSDPVKNTFRDPDGDHTAFWDLYNSMMRRHPFTMVRATIMCTFGHLDPWWRYIFRYDMAPDPGDVDVYFTEPHRDDLMKYWEFWQKVPLVRMMLATGLSTWITMMLVGYAVRRRSGMVFLGLFPAFILFVGLFMSHVNGEIRYGYPLIAVAPLLLAWSVAVQHNPAISAHGAAKPEGVSGGAPGGVPLKQLPGFAAKKVVDNARLFKEKGFPPYYDRQFLKYLNQRHFTHAELMIAWCRIISNCAASFQRKEKTLKRIRAIRNMNDRLSAAKDAVELQERINYFLKQWQHTEGLSRQYCNYAIDQGNKLLQEAEQYRQANPDIEIVDTHSLEEKLDAFHAQLNAARS